jgi:hypothetical protein
VAALEEFAARGTTTSAAGELHPGRARFVLRGAAQLERLVGDRGDRPKATPTAKPTRTSRCGARSSSPSPTGWCGGARPPPARG